MFELLEKSRYFNVTKGETQYFPWQSNKLLFLDYHTHIFTSLLFFIGIILCYSTKFSNICLNLSIHFGTSFVSVFKICYGTIF